MTTTTSNTDLGALRRPAAGLADRPAPQPAAESAPNPLSQLADHFSQVRALSTALCESLSPEDMVVQSMPDASPTKWHLAHTTWFFEAFILDKYQHAYKPYDARFGFLFNSYYNAIGDRHPRARRGMLTRPTAREVLAYRHAIDAAVRELLTTGDEEVLRAIAPLVEIGIHHEQQHQELLLTDIKHLLWQSPLSPAFRETPTIPASSGELGWLDVAGGVHEIGVPADAPAFAYDNESPRHRVYFEDFQIADRLVTNAEFAAFIEDGGYTRPDLWLDAGWSTVREHAWTAPLYWTRDGDRWLEYTLAGQHPIDPHAPVTHISFFEAEAYARWAKARLATEAEWETAAAQHGGDPTAGNLLAERTDHATFHPVAANSPAADPAAQSPGPMRQCFGDCWEWTRSDYAPYPGYQPPAGAIGEYNGKFMCGQFVLRGGSCATPRSHIRATYRNFFAPTARWQFSGIRLARNPA